MKHLLIILSFLLLSSPVIGNSHKGETLYMWGEVGSGDYKWMGFGDKETHPVYKGQVKDGKPNGLGILTYPTGRYGRKYIGNWKDGKLNGQGTSTWSNGDKYVGKWKNGKKNGQGRRTYPDGGKYIGEYKDDKRWDGTEYDNILNIEIKIVNGKKIKQ